MSSRNIENGAPRASKPVKITTAPYHVRLVGGKYKTVSVPVRPQPVPIRNVHKEVTALKSTMKSKSNNNNNINSKNNINHNNNNNDNVKTTVSDPIVSEHLDNVEFRGATTSAAPIVNNTSVAANLNTFQPYQGCFSVPVMPNVAAAAQTTNTLAMDQPAPVNLASKVAEVFLTAGHAFQKLGDLTLQLHTTTDEEESKWSDNEVDVLRGALSQFAHELDRISTCVASRTTKKIKTDIKRDYFIKESNYQVKKVLLNNAPMAGPSSSYVTNANVPGSTVGMPKLQQQQQLLQAISSNVSKGNQIPPVSAVMPMWKSNK